VPFAFILLGNPAAGADTHFQSFAHLPTTFFLVPTFTFTFFFFPADIDFQEDGKSKTNIHETPPRYAALGSPYPSSSQLLMTFDAAVTGTTSAFTAIRFQCDTQVEMDLVETERYDWVQIVDVSLNFISHLLVLFLVATIGFSHLEPSFFYMNHFVIAMSDFAMLERCHVASPVTFSQRNQPWNFTIFSLSSTVSILIRSFVDRPRQ
jgi:hypothetical protein